MKKNLHIAIDGGGTKTIGILFDESGNILKLIRKPFAANAVLSEEVDALNQISYRIISLIDELCLGYEAQVKSVTFTIPGFPLTNEDLRKRLAEMRIIESADNVAACLAAFGDEKGICVSAGTGAFSGYPCPDYPEGYMFCGGWGTINADAGGGYYAGVLALQRLMSDVDSGEFCDLSEALLEKFNLQKSVTLRHDLIVKIYLTKEITRREIAGLSYLIKECAERGSAVAKDIFADCAYKLAEMAYFLYKRNVKDGMCKVALLGGLKNVGECLINPFKEYLSHFSKNLVYVEPMFNNYIGSVLFALKELGLDIKIASSNLREEQFKE